MAISTKQFIEAIEKDFPRHELIHERNFSEEKYIGVVLNEGFTGEGVRYYENSMRDSFLNTSSTFRCYPWKFYDFEIEELRASLVELSNYFGEAFDTDGFFKTFDIRTGEGSYYYIIITIARRPLAKISN